jgi:ATP-binding cassette subfamily B protein
MSQSTLVISEQPTFDLKQTITGSRLAGIWRLMAGFRLAYLGAALSLGVATASRTGALLLIRYFVDSYLTQEVKTVALWVLATGFVALAVAEGFFSFVSGRLTAQTAEGIARRVRNYLLDHIQHLSFAYHGETQTGELITRATSDVDAVRRFFASQAIESVRIIFLFAINFAAILLLNWQLALLSVVVIPIVLVVSVFFFRIVSKAYEQYQAQESVLATRLQENLSGVRVVKAFARQSFEEEKFEEANWGKYRKGKRLLLMHSLYWPLSDVFCAAQMLFGFTIAALMAINGSLTVGDYMAYVGMVIMLIWPIRNLGRLVVDMSQGMVSFQRISEVIREEREVMEEAGFRAPARLLGNVVFEDVSFAYRDRKAENAGNDENGEAKTKEAMQAAERAAVADRADGQKKGEKPLKSKREIAQSGNGNGAGYSNGGDQNGAGQNGDGKSTPARHAPIALQNISFQARPGQRIAVMGATGAGKTTLVNLLPRFYDYTGGRILLDGVELTNYSRDYLRRQIGIVEQEPFLFSRTVRENITFGVGRDVPQEEVEEAARAAAIHDVILEKLPNGYDTLVGERGVTLSGGQKQRVAIARTILKDPRILILDDSTSAVDTETEAQIREALERLMENRTTFIIAHRIQSVMDADLILVLKGGRIVQSGVHEQLIHQEGMYRSIYAAQTRIEDELQKELNRV